MGTLFRKKERKNKVNLNQRIMPIDWSSVATGGATQIVGQALGLATGGIQDARQRKQTQKLTDIQSEANRKQADYSHKLALDMWDKTNYDAQTKQMQKAGLNVGLMYGGGGAGGGTTANTGQAGSVSGASATDPTSASGMGMQMGAQLALIKAQKDNLDANTEKTKAETTESGAKTTNLGATTDKTKADTEQSKFTNTVNEKIGSDKVAERYQWNADKDAIESEKANADWENFKQVGYNNNFTDENSLVSKARKAGWETTIEKAKLAKTENNIAKAEEAVKEFEAGLARQGIDPKSPWWIKIVGDLLDKIGLSPITAIKKAM